MTLSFMGFKLKWSNTLLLNEVKVNISDLLFSFHNNSDDNNNHTVNNHHNNTDYHHQ